MYTSENVIRFAPHSNLMLVLAVGSCSENVIAFLGKRFEFQQYAAIVVYIYRRKGIAEARPSISS